MERNWKRRTGETIKRKIRDGTVGGNDTSDIDSELRKGNINDEQERRMGVLWNSVYLMISKQF